MSDITKVAESIASYGRQIVVGPTVWQPTDGAESARLEYFLVASGEPGGRNGRNYRLTRVVVSDKSKDRTRVIGLLAQMRPPCLIVDTDDELVMAQWMETIWPCQRAKKLRKAIESERK